MVFFFFVCDLRCTSTNYQIFLTFYLVYRPKKKMNRSLQTFTSVYLLKNKGQLDGPTFVIVFLG